MEDAPFRRLRLRTLRALALSGVVFVLLRSIFVPLTLIGVLNRGAVIVYGAFILAFVNESNALRHGLGLAVLSKLLTTVQGVAAPEGQYMLTMLATGSHRVQPLLGAAFGGVTGSVVFAGWSAVDTVLIYIYRQPDVWHVDPDDPELRLMAFEILYIAVSMVVASSLAYNFRTALAELATTSNVRAQFIANMNHELRTPIVGVMGMADGLLLEADLPAQGLNRVRVIRDSGAALLTQVNNILEFSNLSVRAVHANAQPTNVCDVVGSTFNAFGAAATTKALHMSLHVAPEVPSHLSVDGILLQHVLSNLVGNAVKFTAAGSVSVSLGFVQDGVTAAEAWLVPQPFDATGGISAADVASMAVFRVPKPSSERRSRGWSMARQVTELVPHRWKAWAASAQQPTAVRRGSVLWIKVSDTGVGIAPEQFARVLEPFQQGDNSSTRPFGGSGLGLALCRDLVDVLDGEMAFASRPGVGSVFVVALPCTSPMVATADSSPIDALGTTPGPVSPRANAPPPRLRPVAEALGRPCVLIVDDNPINVQVLRRQLHHLGCDALVAVNGAEGVKLFESFLKEQSQEQARPPAMRTRLRLAQHGASSPVGAAPRRLDLILMDLHMPVMDGFSATREIRALERARLPASRAAMPIVTVSADDPVTQRERCEQAGMDGFLRKPVVLSDLAAVIQFHLHR